MRIIQAQPIVPEQRTRQMTHLTGSLTGRGQRPIGTSSTIVFSSATLDNDEVAVHEVVTQSNNRDAIIASVDWLVVVDSSPNLTINDLTLDGCLVPWLDGITSLDLNDWAIVGPFKSLLQVFDINNLSEYGGTSTPIGRDSERMMVHNISAGTQTVYFANTVKYIVNNSSGSSTS